MKLPLIIFFIILVNYSNTFLNMINADSNSLCSPCHGEECDKTYESCRYGTYRDYCGQLTCSKGPNQTCGGMFNVKGKCGDGLRCRCDVCMGCSSITLECYTAQCRPNLDFDTDVRSSFRYPYEFPHNHPYKYPSN